MSYREKLAWLGLLALVAPYAPYFGWVIVHPPTTPLPDWGSFKRFVAAVGTQGLIWIIGLLWLWLTRAWAPADERDRAISRRSIQIGYAMLISCVCVNVGTVMPFTSGGWKLMNHGIASIVLSEVVRIVACLWYYRWGWRG